MDTLIQILFHYLPTILKEEAIFLHRCLTPIVKDLIHILEAI